MQLNYTAIDILNGIFVNTTVPEGIFCTLSDDCDAGICNMNNTSGFFTKNGFCEICPGTSIESCEATPFSKEGMEECIDKCVKNGKC